MSNGSNAKPSTETTETTQVSIVLDANEAAGLDRLRSQCQPPASRAAYVKWLLTERIARETKANSRK